MTTYIIVCRNPASKRLMVISDDDENSPAEFETEDEAYEATKNITICRAWGAEIVPVDR
mgnify:CR=1 FL=1